MDQQIRDVTVHYEDVGEGLPVLMLHGWGADGRTQMPSYEPLFGTRSGWRRIYPDVGGIVKAPIPEWLRGPDDLLEVLLEFMDVVAPGQRIVVASESWGGYLASGVVHRRTAQIAGVLFSVPALEYGAPKRDVPPKVVIRSDPAFVASLRPEELWLLDFFVAQDMAVLDVARSWQWPPPYDPAAVALLKDKPFSFDPLALPTPCPAPTLFILGRQDHIVGYRKAWSIVEAYPRATFALLDRAGHALESEQPTLWRALIADWLDRVEEFNTVSSQGR